MTLTKQQIHDLNRINVSAQKAGLGDVLARIEKIAVAGNEGLELDLIREELGLVREELGGILGMMAGLEKKVNTNIETIITINGSLSKITPQLKKLIKQFKSNMVT